MSTQLRRISGSQENWPKRASERDRSPVRSGRCTARGSERSTSSPTEEEGRCHSAVCLESVAGVGQVEGKDTVNRDAWKSAYERMLRTYYVLHIQQELTTLTLLRRCLQTVINQGKG